MFVFSLVLLVLVAVFTARPDGVWALLQYSPYPAVPVFDYNRQLPLPSNGFQPPGFPNIPQGINTQLTPFQQPQFSPFIHPAQFNAALAQYAASLQNQYASLFQQQQNPFNRIAPSAIPSPYTPPNMAAASAFYGPNGVQQMASLYPANPQSPSIDMRYKPDPAGYNGGGYYGIQTDSYSSSSNDNGVETQKRIASTTVNNNGQITTNRTES